jgi:hypothetical protein
MDELMTKKQLRELNLQEMKLTQQMITCLEEHHRLAREYIDILLIKKALIQEHKILAGERSTGWMS